MTRGELWIGSSRADYGGKPRPALIVQGDLVRDFDSVVACPLTSTDVEAHALRFQLEAGERTGLKQISWIMIEKITAYDKAKLHRRIGQLTAQEMELIDAALLDLLNLRR